MSFLLSKICQSMYAGRDLDQHNFFRRQKNLEHLECLSPTCTCFPLPYNIRKFSMKKHKVGLLWSSKSQYLEFKKSVLSNHWLNLEFYFQICIYKIWETLFWEPVLNLVSFFLNIFRAVKETNVLKFGAKFPNPNPLSNRHWNSRVRKSAAFKHH